MSPSTVSFARWMFVLFVAAFVCGVLVWLSTDFDAECAHRGGHVVSRQGVGKVISLEPGTERACVAGPR